MGANGYRLALFTPAGAVLPDITGYAGLSLAYSDKQVGACVVTISGTENKLTDWIVGSYLEVWRTVDNITYLEGERHWRLLDVRSYRDRQGAYLHELWFYDSLAFLEARHILYAAGTAQAEMTDQADDMLKAIVKDNLGSDAVADRDLSAYITIDADLSRGASITKGFAWQPVLETLREICQQNEQAGGDWLTFDLVRTAPTTDAFRTYVGHRGADRTGEPAISWERGNLREPSIAFVNYASPNHITGAGRGEETARVIASAYLANLTPRTRWEGLIDARNVGTDANTTAELTTLVTAEANAELHRVKPRIYFTGSIAETEDYRWGINVNYGDLVNAEFDGYSFQARINAVMIEIDSAGGETLTVRLEATA